MQDFRRHSPSFANVRTNKLSRKLVVGVLLFFFSAYLLVTSARLSSVDDKIIFDVTKSILSNGSFASSEPLSERENFVEPWFYVEGKDGRAYGKYGLGESLAILPLFALGKTALPVVPASYVAWFPPDYIPFKSPERTSYQEQVENTVIPAFISLLNPVATAATCLLIFLLAYRMGASIGASLAVAGIFGFATAAFPYAKYSFQHPLVTALIVASFYSLFSWRANGAWWRLALSGVCLGFAMLTRYESVASLVVFVPYLLWASFRRWTRGKGGFQTRPYNGCLASPCKGEGQGEGEGSVKQITISALKVDSHDLSQKDATKDENTADPHPNPLPAREMERTCPLSRTSADGCPLGAERARMRASQPIFKAVIHVLHWKDATNNENARAPQDVSPRPPQRERARVRAFKAIFKAGRTSLRPLAWQQVVWITANLLPFLLPVLLFGLVSLWFNCVRFGSPLATGYLQEGFTADLQESVNGLVLSPGRSIFLFSPPALLGLICLPVFVRRRPAEGSAFAALIAVYFVLYAMWSGWEGGWAWGPRYPLPLLPFFILPLVVALQSRSLWPKALVVVLVLVSLPVQLLGVATNFNDFYMERTVIQGMDFWPTVFDWERSQIPGHVDLLSRGMIDLWFYYLIRHGAPVGLRAIVLFPAGLLVLSTILLYLGLRQPPVRVRAGLKPAPTKGLPTLLDNGLLNGARSHALLLLWLVALAHLVAYAFVQTVWSRVDEAQHFHFVEYLAENRSLPVTGKTFISQKVIQVSLAVDQWGWNPPRTVYPPPDLDPQGWQTVPPELQGDERLDWIAANLWYFSYEAMQPPLFYSLGAAPYWLLPDDPFVQLYALRVLSAVLASLTVALAHAAVTEAFPTRRLLALAVALTIALLPGFALNLSQVTNDSLATSLASLCFYLLVRGMKRGFGAKECALIGLVIALSLLTKLTTAYLIPLALVAVGLQWFGETLGRCHRAVVPNERAGSASRRSEGEEILGGAPLANVVKCSAALIGIPALALLPWVLRNWTTYGDLTGSAAASGLLGAIFRPVRLDSLDAAKVHVTESLDHLARTFWFGEPFSPWHHWVLELSTINVLTYLSLFGLAVYFWRAKKEREDGERRVVVLMVAAVAVHVAELLIGPTFGGLGVVGRYLYPSAVPVIALIWLGLLSVAPEKAHRPIVIILVGSLLALDVLNFVSYIQANYPST